MRASRIWKTVGDAGGIGQEEARRQDVQRWFAYLRATPVAADRSAPILSVIMRQTELYGYRPEGSNPCTGIRRYRRERRERFLSMQELQHLARVLNDHETRHPREAAFVRLLLLTGCRKSEIGTLQWSDYRERRLFLRDGKTGPRTVWLSSPARAVLDGAPPEGTVGLSLATAAGAGHHDDLQDLLAPGPRAGGHRQCPASRLPPLLCIMVH